MAKKNGPYKTYKGHFSLPAVLLAHKDFKTLSAKATKLLIDLGSQFNGYNNGDFCITLSIMKHRGWCSNDSLTKAKKELLAADLIFQTRQGGLNMGPNLYCITWQPIHECKGKLDVKSTTTSPRSFREN